MKSMFYRSIPVSNFFSLSPRTISAEIVQRPNFSDIVDMLDGMLAGEKDGDTKKKKPKNRFSALIDRHSTWF